MPSAPVTTEKSPLRLYQFSGLRFEPRFEYGHMAESAEICGLKDGTSLGTGFARMKNARIPWTIQYDEVLIVFEGELRVHADGEIHALSARDSIWLPAGTELIYEADNALAAYAIHPSNWHET
jgi:ethanolamine utilization protein EutQ